MSRSNSDRKPLLRGSSFRLSVDDKEEEPPHPPHTFEESETFLIDLVNLLLEYMKLQQNPESKVVEFYFPRQLKDILGERLEIPKNGVSLTTSLSDCAETLNHCVKTGHPRFFNQLSSGLDLMSVAGEFLTASVNTNMFTYEVAPVFTLMEDILLDHMRKKIGWNRGDGIFAPGGTVSNMYAVNLARYCRLPQCKQEGMDGIRMAIYTSEHSHYSIQQAGALIGLGLKHVILIKCDRRGKMIVSDLESKITKHMQEGIMPVFVNATASTTVYGAFDPIQEIAALCQKHKIWLHVDAAWGGGYLLSRKHRHLLNGIHLADSVTWNPHKLMGTTLQCSAFLTRHKGKLAECNGLYAEYLFQKDKHYDIIFDTGDKAFQCGRRNDVFKLWLMWRSKGDYGFENQMDDLHMLSRHLVNRIMAAEDFELVFDNPESTNVCFWFIPKMIQNLEPGPKREELLNMVAPKIKAAMMHSGSTMVGYQPLFDKPNFFRFILSNTLTTQSDIDFLLEEIRRLGKQLFGSDSKTSILL